MLSKASILTGNQIICHANIYISNPIVGPKLLVKAGATLTIKDVFYNPQVESVCFSTMEVPSIIDGSFQYIEDKYPLQENVIKTYFNKYESQR